MVVERPGDAVPRLVQLLEELGELGDVRLMTMDRTIIGAIQNGARTIEAIASVSGHSKPYVRMAVWPVLRRLEAERDTRAREREGVPPESRPIDDLRLWGPAQVVLEIAGITTIGQLLQRSEQELLRMRLSGPLRVEDIKRRLWATGRWTLRDSSPPSNAQTLLLFPFGPSAVDSVGVPEQALAIVAVIAVTWIAVAIARRRNDFRRPFLLSA